MGKKRSKSATADNDTDSRQVMAEGRFLRLVNDGGWEYAERRNATGVVVIVAITDDDELLLIRQHRRPVGLDVIELPAGLAGDIVGEEEEELTTAARRELLEETGYEAGALCHLTSGPSSAGMTSEILHLVGARRLKKINDGGGIGSENINTFAVPLPEVPGWIARQVSEGATVDPKVYAALFFAEYPDLWGAEA